MKKREELLHPDELVFIQSRIDVNDAVVDDYTEMMENEVEFDPVQAIEDEEAGLIYVWDGQHRAEAARRLDLLLRVTIEPGDEEDAKWLALTANQKHGLRRSRKDTQFVIRQALLHPRGVHLSDRELGRHCGVDHKTIGRMRGELEAAGEIPRRTERPVTRDGITCPQETNTDEGAEDRDEEVPAGESLPDGGWDWDEATEEGEVAAAPGEAGQSDAEDMPSAGKRLPPASPPKPAATGKQAPAAFEQAAAGLPPQPQQRDLRFAQVNQGGVALEITIYVDGEAYNVPVTAMFAHGPIAGLPEMSLDEQQQATLILPYDLGKQMRLVYLDNLVG